MNPTIHIHSLSKSSGRVKKSKSKTTIRAINIKPMNLFIFSYESTVKVIDCRLKFSEIWS